jgi:hypothetical protein
VDRGTWERGGPVAVTVRRGGWPRSAASAPAVPAVGGVPVLCWRLPRVSWPRAAMQARNASPG